MSHKLPIASLAFPQLPLESKASSYTPHIPNANIKTLEEAVLEEASNALIHELTHNVPHTVEQVNAHIHATTNKLFVSALERAFNNPDKSYKELLTRQVRDQLHHYIVGVPDIDTEHFVLCYLATVLRRVSDKEELLLGLHEFVELWDSHTAHEEAYMRSIEYPWTEHHAGSHLRLRADVHMLIAKVKRHEYKTMATGYQGMGGKLSGLLMQHLDTADQQLADFINKQK